MRRIALFLLTNILVLVLVGTVFRIFGLEQYLYQRGVHLDLGALLIFSAVMGFAGSFISLVLSKPMAKLFTRARVITRPSSDDEAWLLSTIERLARQAGIGTPEVAVYQSPDLNAFATGARRNNALVAVSTGLLGNMRKDEIEAVLGHEISHVANGDMVTMTLLQGVMNTFVVFLSRIVGYFVDRVILRNERGHGLGFFLTTMITQIALGILASMVVMWFSRRREFRADAGAASLVGADSMVAALQRLKVAHDEPADLPDSVNAFGIRGGKSWLKLFMSHPPLDERIAALRAIPRP
ncbi:MAG: protease HtpX [Deltaproteobacteria bacterium]|nr:protease HtpX [Deltaproteobacteria bacterium]